MSNIKQKNVEAAKAYFDNYVSSYIDKLNTVEKDEYKNWLVEFTDRTQNKCWSDDDYIYNDSISIEEKHNIQLLSYFYSYVSTKKNEQQVIFSELDKTERDDFYEDMLIFKLKNNYYKMLLAVGQGSFTVIEKLDYIPQRFVYIDEDIPEKEILLNEYLEYIYINKDIKLNNVELFNYIASLSTIISIEESKKEEYKYWYKESLQKREFIYLSSKEINKISDASYNIKFRKTNDIIILSFGIKTRQENEKILKKIKEDN